MKRVSGKQYINEGVKLKSSKLLPSLQLLNNEPFFYFYEFLQGRSQRGLHSVKITATAEGNYQSYRLNVFPFISMGLGEGGVLKLIQGLIHKSEDKSVKLLMWIKEAWRMMHWVQRIKVTNPQHLRGGQYLHGTEPPWPTESPASPVSALVVGNTKNLSPMRPSWNSASLHWKHRFTLTDGSNSL